MRCGGRGRPRPPGSHRLRARDTARFVRSSALHTMGSEQ